MKFIAGLHLVNEAPKCARSRSRRPFKSAQCCFYEGLMTAG
jgi:hypothetical protein